jgi:hypothetical protein
MGAAMISLLCLAGVCREARTAVPADLVIADEGAKTFSEVGKLLQITVSAMLRRQRPPFALELSRRSTADTALMISRQESGAAGNSPICALRGQAPRCLDYRPQADLRD